MRKLIGIIVVGMILTLMPGQRLFAQTDDEARQHFREAMRQSQGEHRQQRKHLEQLRLLKMLELLDLETDQEVPFLTAFNKMRQEHREVDQQTRRLLDSLAGLIEVGRSDDKLINQLVDRVHGLENEKHKIASEFLGQARAMLTAEQLGKFVIFQKRFESELLERVGRFRRGMNKGEFGRQRQGG